MQNQRERKNIIASHRDVEIKVRAGFKQETYESCVLRIDKEKINLLAPVDERSRVIQVPYGSEVTLNFTDIVGTPAKTYRTMALNQEWDEKLNTSILTVSQPEDEPVSMRQFVRHGVDFDVSVQLLNSDEQFKAVGTDLSGEGLQITMMPEQGEGITSGTELLLKFDIQGEGITYKFEVVGKVMRLWNGLFDSRPAKFFGIHAKYDEDDQQAILQYIIKDQIRRISGTPPTSSAG